MEDRVNLGSPKGRDDRRGLNDDSESLFDNTFRLQQRFVSVRVPPLTIAFSLWTSLTLTVLSKRAEIRRKRSQSQGKRIIAFPLFVSVNVKEVVRRSPPYHSLYRLTSHSFRQNFLLQESHRSYGSWELRGAQETAPPHSAHLLRRGCGRAGGDRSRSLSFNTSLR